mmetsp:Transcript_4352/g.7273  ORF Transcript_4352/g.7273 Transcript_4352/m.7273 type:complete len:84 (-) Transcript_4352:773-1024(-)
MQKSFDRNLQKSLIKCARTVVVQNAENDDCKNIIECSLAKHNCIQQWIYVQVGIRPQSRNRISGGDNGGYDQTTSYTLYPMKT